MGCSWLQVTETPKTGRSPRWYFKAPLLSDPLGSAFLGPYVGFSLQLVPKRLPQIQASHVDPHPLAAKNCPFQPGTIFKTFNNQYRRAPTSEKKLQLNMYGPAEYQECVQGCRPKNKEGPPPPKSVSGGLPLIGLEW